MIALDLCFSLSIPTLLFIGVVYVHDHCGHPRVAVVEIYGGQMQTAVFGVWKRAFAGCHRSAIWDSPCS